MQPQDIDSTGPGHRLRGRRSLSRPRVVRYDQPGAPSATWRLPTGVASITVCGRRLRHDGPLFTLAAAPSGVKGRAAVTAGTQPSALHLLLHRPLALLSLIPTELAMFLAGGVAGAIAKTTTAPLDRVRRV